MTNPTPHGQVPEALIDLIDAYAETRYRYYNGIYHPKTKAARKAVIEALSGVQALSAAPAEQQTAPKAAPGAGNSGFDHQTAADFLSGKTVSNEAVRKFVAASRGAHDARAALHAKMLSLQGELASREAEIALLKRSLLDAEATAAQAVVQDDLITLRKPATSAEMLWLLKLAHLVISDMDKTLEKIFAPAQPAAEASRFGSPELQAMIIARCVEKDQADSVPAVSDLPPLPAPDLRDVGTKPQEIKEFLKGYATEYARTAIAARAPADSVQEDAALWHWLAEYLVGTRTDLDDEIVASETVNDLRKLVEAARKQGEKQ